MGLSSDEVLRAHIVLAKHERNRVESLRAYLTLKQMQNASFESYRSVLSHIIVGLESADP